MKKVPALIGGCVLALTCQTLGLSIRMLRSDKTAAKSSSPIRQRFALHSCTEES